MIRHKLTLDDSNEYTQTIIGISSELEDFKLAYLLNKNLYFSFKKSNNIKSYNPVECNFSVFDHLGKENETDWNLINNFCRIDTIVNQDGLFQNVETTVTSIYHLLKEKKQFRYFIKTEEELTIQQTEHLLSVLRNIPNIIYTEVIDFNSLKNKNNLIL